METAGRRPGASRPYWVGVGVRGDCLPHYGSSHQRGARKRADENSPHVVSRKTGKNRANHAADALCLTAQRGTKTGSAQTGSVSQFSSPQAPASRRDTFQSSFRRLIPPRSLTRRMKCKRPAVNGKSVGSCLIALGVSFLRFTPLLASFTVRPCSAGGA